jgi:hypothetical protein
MGLFNNMSDEGAAALQKMFGMSKGSGSDDSKKYSYDAGTQKYAAMAKGGMTASKRADGCAERGKTKGTMIMCGGGMAKK